MSLKTTLCNNIKLILTVSFVLLGIVFQGKFQSLYSSFMKVNKPAIDGLFSREQLMQYNGVHNKKLYLALLGTIFDVTKGEKHYGKEASYNYFVGKDGSRAFVTGDFNDESKNKDHVLDLTCDQLNSLLHWKDTFKSKYKLVGILIGRYYNDNGKPTEYSDKLALRLEQCKLEKEVARQEEQKYPPCNMEWSADQGSKVWCTDSSGGISRRWVGVPRQLFTPGEKNPRCACVNLEDDHTSALLKVYVNCSPTSTSCVVET